MMTDNMTKKKIVIMAGGTGGHVFPALAVAKILQHNDVAIVWLGTQIGIEADLVPKQNIKLHFLSISGLRGKGIKKILLSPFQLVRAVVQAWQILHQEKPHAVLGMGGFASGPGAIAAWLLGIPIVIHEQNSVPGLTNRVLAKIAKKVLQAFPNTFPTRYNALNVGNPLREEFDRISSPEERLSARTGNLRLLVLGGSRGALALNTIIPASLAQLSAAKMPEIWHQTGKEHLDKTRALYHQQQINARITDFIDDVCAAYCWADLVICRAGALTVSEISVVGVASILVPFPYAVDDHQRVNAHYLAQQQAAFLINQDELTVEKLVSLLEELQADRNKLLQMAVAAQQVAIKNAASVVAQYCLEVCCD
jgi:UDP-N-acetylglucosamine--N-acetylmuramyl-(pentapeptide) pyrophosphoryl-undecaprenol N-acetylglucosamine transferase